MWQLTKFAEDKFKHIELKTFLLNKAHDFIPDTCSFVLPGMGIGHFYLEDYSVETKEPAATIFFNEDYSMCLYDAIVARWVGV